MAISNKNNYLSNNKLTSQKIIKQIYQNMQNELVRQQNTICLIASENYVDEDILIANGSILTNKYAEGYPNHRYYGGCEYIDQIENTAIELAKQLFSAKYANVQPHSGSQANFAVYLALLKPNDTILALDLNAGGHLTHGAKVNFSGKLFNFIHYSVDQKTQLLNYDMIAKLAKQYQPKLIVTGYSNYSQIIDFKKFSQIAKSVNAYLLADIAHIAGLIAGQVHPNPLPYADVVTSTTQKSLRGPRGGFILTNNPEIAKKIDKAVFPGGQGGPLENTIAAKAMCFAKALQPSFKTYAQNIVKNAKAFCQVFLDHHCKIISNGTNNHLFTIDLVKTFNITGDIAIQWLNKVGIIANMNTIPYDTNSPKTPSGLRIGVSAMTTRGFKIKHFQALGKIIIDILTNHGDLKNLQANRKKVVKLLNSIKPIYPTIKYV